MMAKSSAEALLQYMSDDCPEQTKWVNRVNIIKKSNRVAKKSNQLQRTTGSAVEEVSVITPRSVVEEESTKFHFFIGGRKT
jgi:hypothetical protein|mmetsp:Transcript_12435/g.17886  ORF Transcript_12435/g.17886 Transcript_12435/m.17886 type:complete len:81 (-) Transcript_12435:390-632(-)